MPHRIEVASDVVNAEGDGIKKKIQDNLGISVDSVKTISVYTIDGDLSPLQLERLGKSLFSDPVTERFSVDKPLAEMLEWDQLFEVGYRPGVTDNVGMTAQDALKDIIRKEYPVYTSKQHLVKGRLARGSAERISKLLSSLPEYCETRNREEWERNPIGIYIPSAKMEPGSLVTTERIRAFSDPMLNQIGNVYSIDPAGMRVVREYYINLGRDPTDAELHVIAGAQCDHCKHTTFNAKFHCYENGKKKAIDSLFNTYIKAATEEIRRRLGKNDWLVSVFRDNSGILDLGDGFSVLFKVETHNYPSALDPYSGAGTGTAVVRDVMGAGKGGRPIAYTDILCFGVPDLSCELPLGVLHPLVTAEGVIKGIEHGGNKKGIATVNGTIRYDSYPYGSNVWRDHMQTYTGRPLVYSGCLGIMPSIINGESSHLKKANPGDLVVVIGGRTGADGVHGATGSSRLVDPNSPITSVQIAAPFVEKKNIDLLLEARDRGLYNSITDLGAMGISGATSEMGRESGGVEIDLKDVRLKYPVYEGWKKLISESQERMLVAVPPHRIGEFADLAKSRDVEVDILGRFTNDGYYRVNHGDTRLVDISMDFLHSGFPQKEFTARWEQPVYEEPQFKQPDLNWALKSMLSRWNVCSKGHVVRQYDHEVQASTVVKPLTGARDDGPSDAAVIWPLELQKKGSYRGIVVANGINANYGLIDTYHMAASNIDEAIRNAVAVGANPGRIALLDNFCWSRPEDPYRAAQLVRACEACYDYPVEFLTPFISGKDSMHNEFVTHLNGREVKIAVPPTLLISSLGIIPDIRKAMTMDAKQPDSLIYVLGITNDETGGSEYYAMMGSEFNKAWVGNKVPRVNATSAKRLYRALYRAIQSELVHSCHDCSDGGLGVALAEMAFAGGYGMKINLEKVPSSLQRDDYLLFSESNSRLIVEVPQERAHSFEKTMRGNVYAPIGTVTKKDRFDVYGLSGRQIMYERIDALKDAWQKTLRW